MPAVGGERGPPVGQRRAPPAACRSPRRTRSAAPPAAWSARRTGDQRDGEVRRRTVEASRCSDMVGARFYDGGACAPTAARARRRCAAGRAPAARVSSEHQRGGAGRVRQRGHERPAEHDVRQPAGQLPATRQQPPAPPPNAGARSAGAAHERHASAASAASTTMARDAVRIVDRGQRVERQAAAVCRAAELAQQREAFAEVHRRPPLCLGRSGKSRAGEHRVVRADPAAERDLHGTSSASTSRHSRSAAVHATASGTAAVRLAPAAASSASKVMPAEQVRGDDRRVQLHRHRERAERALQAHPDAASRWPTTATRGSVAAPRRQLASRHARRSARRPRREVAVDHLDPRLAVRHRAARQGRSARRRCRRARRAGWPAVAAGPVGAAEARIGQPREGAEQRPGRR